MKPSILVARAVFPEVVQRLQPYFEVDANNEDRVLPPDELRQRLQGKVGALTTGSERIDEALLAANPQLRVVANIAVGYNNFDVAACTAHGVLCTNTPDVLTETTADFGFALMMATARRIAESEHYLRRGEWTRWALDMFVGSDIHGATLGILGMGRIGQGDRAARCARLRHAGDLSQPLAPRRVARGRVQGALRRQGRRCCAKPTTWCWCCRTRPSRTMRSAPPNWRR